jgi:hypothetical protein
MIKISNGRQQVSYLDKQKKNKIKLRDPGRQYKIISSKTKQMQQHSSSSFPLS